MRRGRRWRAPRRNTRPTCARSDGTSAVPGGRCWQSRMQSSTNRAATKHPMSGSHAPIARAIRARGRGLDESPEQPQGGAVGDEHEIADHARRKPRREAALRRGGGTQPRVFSRITGVAVGQARSTRPPPVETFPTGGAPTVRQFLVVVFSLIRSCPRCARAAFLGQAGARVGPDRLKVEGAERRSDRTAMRPQNARLATAAYEAARLRPAAGRSHSPRLLDPASAPR